MVLPSSGTTLAVEELLKLLRPGPVSCNAVSRHLAAVGCPRAAAISARRRLGVVVERDPTCGTPCYRLPDADQVPVRQRERRPRAA